MNAADDAERYVRAVADEAELRETMGQLLDFLLATSFEHAGWEELTEVAHLIHAAGARAIRLAESARWAA